MENPFNSRYDISDAKIKQLENYQGLRLQTRPKDLAELLQRLIWKKECTYFTHGRKQSSGKWRSLGDIFRIVHFYNHKVNYEDLKNLFYAISKGDYESKPGALLVCNWCSVVKKHVHWAYSIRIDVDVLRSKLGKNNIKF